MVEGASVVRGGGGGFGGSVCLSASGGGWRASYQWVAGRCEQSGHGLRMKTIQ